MTANPQSSLPALAEPRIVIEKSRGVLTVYDGSQPIRRYPASAGSQPGDKYREGDQRTPVGVFYVCTKNPVSKFTLSLGLSYPAPEDADRGLRAGLIDQLTWRRIRDAHRAGRQPPWNTPLGGAIMIHGDRRGGRDTLGCIALEDSHIRELYPRIPLGTPVTIQP